MTSNGLRWRLLFTCLVVVAAGSVVAADAEQTQAEKAVAGKEAGLAKMLEKGGFETFTPVGGTPPCPGVWPCGLAACGVPRGQDCLYEGTVCSPGNNCSDVDTGLTECQIGTTGVSCLGGKTIHTRTCTCVGCPANTCDDGCATATARTLVCK